MDTQYKKVKWGPRGTRKITTDVNWGKPVAWNKAAETLGVRYRVFCASLADVFEDWRGPIINSKDQVVCSFEGSKNPADWIGVDEPEGGATPRHRPITMNDVRARLFRLIDATPHLDWMLLTKRPENIRRMFVPHCLERSPGRVAQNEGDGTLLRARGNVWLGTSVEDQERASRLDELRKCRDLSPVLFVSAEPLLGPLDLRPHLSEVDLVIVGGESGPDARPFNIDWAGSLVRQCKTAQTACFIKQMGANGFAERNEVDGYKTATPIKVKIGAGPAGEDFDKFPRHLQVREMPVPRFAPAPPAPATLGKLF